MRQKVDHPSQFIDKKFSAVIQQSAAEAERMKDLHPEQLKLIYENKWFKMFIPREYGGLGWSLPQVLRSEEALSWADGSTGWVVTLCGGAGWFAGFLEPTLIKQILTDEKACFAGSGASTGIANIKEDGYEVTGFWKYASGSLHATSFTANCVICKEGHPLRNSDGSPMVKAFLFLKDEVTLLKHWNSMGMVATASHSFEVSSLLVPSNRCFMTEGKEAVLEDPVFQYPFMQLAQTTLSVNLSGMAVRFLELCDPIFSEKMKQGNAASAPDRQHLLASANAEMNEWRSAFYTAVEASWQACEHRQIIPQPILENVIKSSHALARRSLRLVDELYPYCGLIAADPRQEINRVWRNIHTASQHALFVSG